MGNALCISFGMWSEVKVQVCHLRNETSKPAPFKDRRVRHPQKISLRFSGVEVLATHPLDPSFAGAALFAGLAKSAGFE
jgi:hypothetical protein